MTEKKFDQRTVEQAQEAAQQLLDACPELASVSIQFGWDLPQKAIDSLISGVWAFRDNSATYNRVLTMQRQLLSLLLQIGPMLTQIINKNMGEKESNDKI